MKGVIIYHWNGNFMLITKWKVLGRVKVICRFWGRSEVAVVKSPGLRVCKIKRRFYKLNVGIFWGGSEKHKKMEKLAGMVEYSALVCWIITWVMNTYNTILIFLFLIYFSLVLSIICHFLISQKWTGIFYNSTDFTLTVSFFSFWVGFIRSDI